MITLKKTAVYVMIAFMVGCFFGCAAGGGGSKDKTSSTTPVSETTQVAPEKTEEKPQTPKGKAQTIGAGKFIVGKDIVAGRYKATHKGRVTNFAVWSSDKTDLKVNCMLGKDKLAEEEYTFWAEDGDLVESGGKIQLTPVD